MGRREALRHAKRLALPEGLKVEICPEKLRGSPSSPFHQAPTRPGRRTIHKRYRHRRLVTGRQIALWGPILGQVDYPRRNKSTPRDLPGLPRGTFRKMSKRYGKVLPGTPRASRGGLFHNFSIKNAARPSAAPPQGGGGFAAAPLWGAFLIEKLWKSRLREAGGVPGDGGR